MDFQDGITSLAEQSCGAVASSVPSVGRVPPRGGYRAVNAFRSPPFPKPPNKPTCTS